MDANSRAVAYFDASVQQANGPAAVGGVISVDGVTIKEISVYVGERTNNEGEYLALLHVVCAAADLRIASVTFYGDSLLVVNQNLTATHVDSELRRQVRYHVRLDPGREPASLAARAEVTLRNEAVAENRTYLSVYSSLALPRPPPGVQAADELGRRAYSASVTIPGQQSRTVTLDVEGRMELAADKWYHLELGHQASLAPDDVHVSLSVPRGWRIAEVAGGMRTVDDRHAVAELGLSSPAELSVRLERTPWSRLWARIRD